jgi:hypothetical protein
MKLIDKDALVAEIEKLKEHVPFYPTWAEKDSYTDGVDDALDKIYTLEVKEVDLHLAYHDFLESHKTTGYMLFEVAEYFFELGLKAQKGEKV